MSNANRLTETHFRRYEVLLHKALTERGEFHYVVPIPQEQYELRTKGSTVAVNLQFAIRWYLEQTRNLSSLFDRPTVLDFQHHFVLCPDKDDQWAVRARRRSGHVAFKPAGFAPTPTAPLNESGRLTSLQLDVANLALFRSVLTCMQHRLITWPVPFNGPPVAIHHEYCAELGQGSIELCEVEETTVLVPITA